MARGMPSLAALLGLVAVAGFANRDKIGEFVKGLSGPGTGGGSGGMGGGIGDLITQFKNKGLGQQADSWVSTGPNQPVDENQMSEALGPDLIDTLVKQTGLPREELLQRLSKVLPEAVDKMTPDGRVPA